MILVEKIKILHALANNNPYTTEFPCGSTYRDGNRLIATNGWQLLAFNYSDKEAIVESVARLPTLDAAAKARRAVTSNRKHSKTPDLIRTWLKQEADMRDVDMLSLLQFLGADEYMRCPCCAGSGQRDFDEKPPKDFNRFDGGVEICGVKVLGNLLVSVLARLPKAETVQVGALAGLNPEMPKVLSLRVEGDGWILIQQSATEDLEISGSFPEAI